MALSANTTANGNTAVGSGALKTQLLVITQLETYNTGLGREALYD